MAMPMEITEEQTPVRTMTPVDVSGMRDPGMQALIILAVSLGWDVMQKPNNPAVITSPLDGRQKRLPTNTSIRMSVFQTSLSTIMAHSELLPHVELIDEIVKATKLSHDHARRLYLAVGEDTKQHRERIDTVTPKREPDEHLMQTIVLPRVNREPDAPIEWVDPPVTETEHDQPADGGDHGKLLDSRPYMAHHHADAGGRVKTYQSDTSFQRTWEDGFIDYACQICGRPYKTPKGVGSHRQVHTKAGEIPKDVDPAWKRAETKGEEVGWTPTTTRSDKGKPRKMPPPVIDEADVSESTSILDQILLLVAPNFISKIQTLEAENDFLQNRVLELEVEATKLRSDWEALRGLIDGR